MSLAQESDDRTISTRETAAAFIEDMRHLRDVVNKPGATELRRLTNILRRLLIDGDHWFSPALDDTKRSTCTRNVHWKKAI
jgi:hypothetical protein